jgi:hypothetical protein
VNAGVKYLSTIDPYTGIVTHVSNPGWNVGIWKPIGGGSFINQLTGDFFYSAAGHTLISVNTGTGNLVYNQIINSGDLFGIQHFSDCSCITTDLSDITSEYGISITPNPFHDFVQVSLNTNEKVEIVFYDMLGARTQLQQYFTGSVSLDTYHLKAGVYLYEIRKSEEILIRGKLLKE